MSGTLTQQPRVRVPRSARPGETIEIRTLMEHPMESGIRGAALSAVPRDILTRLVVRMNGATVFAADLGNGTAANPYHVFFLRMPRAAAAELEFTWSDERGRTARATARVAAA